MGGEAKTNDFSRLFMVPGMAHCVGGTGPTPTFGDWLPVLEEWVEEGITPDQVIVSHVNPNQQVDRTRPLCPYPKVATYIGSGSIDDAANFICEER
jgi:feruloyl esterase